VLSAPVNVPIQNSELRTERIRQGLSLRELAYFVGCSHVTICRLELGTLDAAPALRARIARALRIRVCKLWPEPETA
jgi:predicted transcriptional regulator